MNCPKCGSPAGRNDEYCGGCGYHLRNGNVPGGTETGKRKKSGILILVLILEVIAIAAVAAVILFKFSDKGTSSDREKEVSSSENVEESEDPGAEEETETVSAEQEHESETQTAEKETPEQKAPEAHLIDNVETLNEVKNTYTRLTQDKLTNSVASTTIEQDLVANEPVFVFNNDDTTNWQEGAAGAGIGEYIDFSFDKAYTVGYMTFKLGNWKSDEYYNGNYRPKTLLIQSGDNSWELTFADTKQEFLVQLDPEAEMRGIRITIQEVYSEHTQWEDTPITEVGLWYK